MGASGGEVKGLSLQEILDRLGVYRESATMALNELKLAGLIDIKRKQIAILDRDLCADTAANELLQTVDYHAKKGSP